MSLGLSHESHSYIGLPSYSIGTLPTGAPSTLSDAHGRVGDAPRVNVDISGACTLTLYVWNPYATAGAGAWRLASATSSGYQIVFADAGMDFFDAPPHAFIYLRSSAGSITCLADVEDPTPTRLK